MKETDLFLLRLENYHIKNINGQDASPAQIYTLRSFMNILTLSKYKTLFARGESDANLLKHYCVDTASLDQLLKTIFCIGEKGRICLYDSDWIDPDDIGDPNFTKICRLLNSAIKSADKGNPGRIKKMQEFILRNQAFADAFLSDKESLVIKYNNLCDEKRKMINLYYLAILHTINSNSYKNNSIFVSASQNPEVAELFEQSLMFVGWVPKDWSSTHVAFEELNRYITICNSVGLPVVNTPVYPEQLEISIRYGILPHFIIGIKIKNEFYVNPALYKTMELFGRCISIKQMKQLRTDIIMHGLKVSQERFMEYCRIAGYRRYYTYDGSQYRINSVN